MMSASKWLAQASARGTGRRTTPFLVAALAAVATALTACADAGDPAGWAGTVDTLENGAVLVSSPADGLWREDQAWHLSEGVRIGSLDGDGPEVFAGIDGLAVDGEGRIYVLDREAAEVRVFGPGGEHVRTFGREGKGPGELALPVHLDFVPGEGVWVVDVGNQRFSLFTVADGFVRSRPREAGGMVFGWRGDVRENGELLDHTFYREGDDFVSALVRFGPEGQPMDTVRFPSYDRETYTLQGSSASGASFTMSVTVPFAPNLVLSLDPRGFIWSGVSDRYRIHRQDLEGDTTLVVERAYTPVPVTAQERQEVEERIRERDSSADLSRIPDQKPAFDAIFVADDRHLWVRPETTPEMENRLLDVFGPDGRYLGRVTSPVPVASTPAPVITGDAVYAATFDDLGVGYVVRLDIHRPALESD